MTKRKHGKAVSVKLTDSVASEVKALLVHIACGEPVGRREMAIATRLLPYLKEA